MRYDIQSNDRLASAYNYRLLQAGHGALSPHLFVNTVIGLALHTFILVPYFSWRVTHRTHHVS
jgi:hypothetical protein